MSELTTIARPYAKAAFDHAVENGNVEHWATMLAFAAEVAKNETIASYLAGGASAEQSQDLFIKVCGEQVDEKGQNLIRVMAENKRLPVLPQVLTQFCELKAEYDKEITVDVTSAVELSAEQQTSISAALEKRLARKVKLNCKLDPSIVSGLLIKAGDMVIDGSIKGKLNRMSSSLQS